MSTPTAPLPRPAVEALARLEAAGLPVGPTTMAIQHGMATAHALQLAALAEATGTLSDLDADDLAHAEDLKFGVRATLAAAGRLDLVGGA